MGDAGKITLYHYTAPVSSHLGSILTDGCIHTTESNLSFAETRVGPDVVWLTDSTDPAVNEWATGSPLKLLSVLTVQLSPEHVHHWPEWSREHEIDEVTYKGLAASGGDPETWWVSTRPIQKWDITRLVIAPFKLEDKQFEMRDFAGQDLSRLFRSAGARKALELPVAKARSIVG